MDNMSETLMRLLFIWDFPLMASSNGVRVMVSSMIPTILLEFPSNRLSTEKTPIREANTLSKQEGVPPLCMCPNTDTLTS